MLTQAGVSIFTGLTTDDLKAALKVFQALTQATTLKATNDVPIQFQPNTAVRYTPEELKDRANRYLRELHAFTGAHYIQAMLQFPQRHYHTSQFLYSDFTSDYEVSDFTDEQGIALPGVSICFDLSLDISSTDLKTLYYVSKRLNVIKEQKSLASHSGNHPLVEDLCDEEERLLSYVRKAASDPKLADRAAKITIMSWMSSNV
jgi:hypothetical protein